MIFQDIDCTMDNKMKSDLMGSRELPDVSLGKEISMGNSSSTVKMVVIFIFILDHFSC